VSKKDIEAKTEALLKIITEPMGIEIYDVEYVKEGQDMYLRAYIDKEGGVNINDCEAVSRPLSDALDADDYIEEAYILEVSSPGLGRMLKKDKHLEKSMGEPVDIKLYKPMDGCKEFTGDLTAFDVDTITIRDDDTEYSFERKAVAGIWQHVEF